MSLPIYPELNKKKAIVTGGATGIGRAIAKALVDQQVSVCICDANIEAAKKTASELGCHAMHVDVRDRSSVETCFTASIDLLGGLDLLFANAGVSSMQHALELTDDDWNFNFDVNTRGVFLTNQIAARHFVKQGHGTIINTASLAAKVGAPLLAHYSASKFAVVGWTQALAREMADKGIRVNAVCPGFVATGMQEREVVWEAELRDMTPKGVIDDYVSQTPLGRLEEPEDVADVAVFLCSDSARFMTGQAVNVTGGVYMT